MLSQREYLSCLPCVHFRLPEFADNIRIENFECCILLSYYIVICQNLSYYYFIVRYFILSILSINTTKIMSELPDW